jgi:hypothetical protein
MAGGGLDNVIGEKHMLNGHNYKEWKSLMRSVLQREDLWDLVAPTVTPASSSNDDLNVDRRGKKPADTAEALTTAEIELRRRRRDRAMAFLRLAVTEDIRPRIEDMDDPAATWAYLAQAFQTNTIADTMVILNQWESLRMHDNQDVSTFISSVHRILRDLKNIGQEQNDIVVVNKILNRLPSRFANFAQLL